MNYYLRQVKWTLYKPAIANHKTCIIQHQWDSEPANIPLQKCGFWLMRCIIPPSPPHTPPTPRQSLFSYCQSVIPFPFSLFSWWQVSLFEWFQISHPLCLKLEMKKYLNLQEERDSAREKVREGVGVVANCASCSNVCQTTCWHWPQS